MGRSAARYVPILLQKSKIGRPQNLAKADLWTSLLLRRVNKHRSGTPSQMTAMLMQREKIRFGGVWIGADKEPGCLPSSRTNQQVAPHVARGSYFGAYSHMRDAPVLMEVANPSSQDRMPRRAIVLVVPVAAAPYRASGLVH